MLPVIAIICSFALMIELFFEFKKTLNEVNEK